MPNVVAVTGGRDYFDMEHICSVLNRLHALRPITLLVHGACHVNERRNADFGAEAWAVSAQVPYLGVPANSRAFGWPMAGPIRNTAMLKDYGVSKLVAFPGGRGTDGCVRIAEAMNALAKDTIIEIYDERGYSRS